jgi:hypothetical protein
MRAGANSLRSPAQITGDLSYKVPAVQPHSQEWLCHPGKSPRATHKERERALGYKFKIRRLAGLALSFVFGMAFEIERYCGAD